GAMQMLGINALIDIAARWEQWPNKQLVVVVLNNHDLKQGTWEQRVMSGDPKLVASQALPDFDYRGYAELLGLRGVRVDDAERVGGASDEGLDARPPPPVDA